MSVIAIACDRNGRPAYPEPTNAIERSTVPASDGEARTGVGTVRGVVSVWTNRRPEGVVVSALSSRTGRTFETVAGVGGAYSIHGIDLDTTIIVVATSPDTGEFGTHAGVLTSSSPNATVDVAIVSAEDANPLPANLDFSAGLEGWRTTGSVTVVPRGAYFDLPQDE